LGAIDLTWVDHKISDNVFYREIGKSKIYFMDGEIVLRKQILPAKEFRGLKAEKELKSNFVTFDIESVMMDRKQVPYLISIYNGNVHLNAYTSNIEQQELLFNQFINNLLTFFTGRLSNLLVYAHNLSSFDGIFLLKHLHKYGKVNPIYFKGKLMSIELRINSGVNLGKSIIFRDSFLLLPSSLSKLCKAFKVQDSKTLFPFKLYDVNYSGTFPKFEYWTGLTNKEWIIAKELYGKIIWNFKDEAIKYCQLDCKSLHQVLTSFNKLIFDNFKINTSNALTFPSLAMRIYKTHFMPKGKIYQIAGEVEKAIRQSYTGGAVDVYVPHNKKCLFYKSNEYNKLKVYDVNALYPFSMKSAPMPVGKPVYF
jgi:hypothetical protein